MSIRFSSSHIAICSVALSFLFSVPVTGAQAQEVRSVPPPGVTIPENDRKELTDGVAALAREIQSLQSDLKGKPQLLRFLPDVQIYEKAVRYVLSYNEFYDVKQVATARQLLAQGNERAKALRNGDASWMKQNGLLALGYISKIDGSVQPYGIVVPKEWIAGDKTPRRLDFFCHGRGEQLTELAFINERQNQPGEFTPPGAFVIHPYGRFCCANRFAGEVDWFEALADAKTRYAIDSDRTIVRGFSMGGASCWQYATHYADWWAAAAPGAGFSETLEFLRLDPTKLPPYEVTLMRWYNPTDYATNLYQCPTVAYNGADDGQKQAADRMQDAMAQEGLRLTRVVAPKTGHWYNADAKKEIDSRLAVFAEKGRDTLPTSIRFTTFTLRYNSMNWITVTGLGQHWERARVNADRTEDGITIQTENITRLSLSPKVADAARKSVTIDGERLKGTAFAKTREGKWTVDRNADARRLRKKPGLQGPIDDAFMDRFVMVKPTGVALNPRTGGWTDTELQHAVRAWRAQMRGDAPVLEDIAVTDAEIRSSNLVLWGDPSSNAVLARIAGKLPVKWEKDGSIRVGAKVFPAGTSVPILVYPNPLNPNRYIVLNSGLTWRESAYLNNAQQRPRLPDWAVIDITTPPDVNSPGRIADAGFFDEEWKVQTNPIK